MGCEMTKLKELLGDLRKLENWDREASTSILVVKQYSAHEAVELVRRYIRDGFLFLDKDGKLYKRKDKIS
jgi:hypothetical protein